MQLQGGRRSARPPRLCATRAQERSRMTYVAFVPDDAYVNERFPRFIIGDQRNIFPTRGFEELFNASPTLIYLIRGPTSWITHELLAQTIRVLGAACRAVRPDSSFLLSFGIARAHLHAEVLQQCHEECFFILLVSENATILLQPLDVYVFRSLKE